MEDAPLNKSHQAKDDPSLMSLLEKQLNFNETHLGDMERFLEQKREEVVDLQKYLFQEFQHIEDFKDKERRLRRCFNFTVQPLLTRFKTFLKDIEQLAPQVCVFAFKQIQVLSRKATQIIQNNEAALREKDAQIMKLQNALRLCSMVKKQEHQTNVSPNFPKEYRNKCKVEPRFEKENILAPVPSVQKIDKIANNEKHSISKESLRDRVAEIYWPQKQYHKKTSSPKLVQQELSPLQFKAERTSNMKENYLAQTSREADGKHLISSSEWRMRGQNKSEHSHSMNQLVKNQIHYEPIDPYLKREQRSILRDRSVKKIGQEIKRSLKEGLNRTGERREEIKQKISRLRERGEGRKLYQVGSKCQFNQQ